MASKEKCAICHRSLFMEGAVDHICTDCVSSSPHPDLGLTTSVLWAARRAWTFATEGEPDSVLIAPALPGDPGPSAMRSRQRRRR